MPGQENKRDHTPPANAPANTLSKGSMTEEHGHEADDHDHGSGPGVLTAERHQSLPAPFQPRQVATHNV
jgi:hypothetical protein